MEVLVSHGVFSESEVRSRYEIQMENYVRTVRIEALTMCDMAMKEILPAVSGYSASLAGVISEKKAADGSLACRYELKTLSKLSSLEDEIDEASDMLKEKIDHLDRIGDITKQAYYVRDEIIPAMQALRSPCDEAETDTASEYWPFPTYGDLLFAV
jgi:glutamine synthetase